MSYINAHGPQQMLEGMASYIWGEKFACNQTQRSLTLTSLRLSEQSISHHLNIPLCSHPPPLFFFFGDYQ